MDWFSRIFDVDKLPFKIILWGTVVSGVLVLAPTAFLGKLGLDAFVKTHGTYVGVVFLAAGSLVGINALGWSFGKVRRRVAYWKWRNSLLEVLESLDHAEKAVLREFYIQARHTVELPMDNPTVVGLQNKGIVCPAGEYGQHSLAGILLPFSISEEARSMITVDMLDLPTGEPSKQEIARLQNSRPDFARVIQSRKDLLNW